MSGFFNRVVAVTTVQFQLAGVQFVTEGNRLLGLVAYVDNRRMDCRKQTGSQIAGRTESTKNQHHRKFVDPCWKMELLHDVHSTVVSVEVPG